MKLNQLMWRILLRVFLVALPLAVVAVWAGQTASVAAMKRAVMASNRDQLRSALVKVSDRRMLDKAWRAAGMLSADGALTDEQMDRLLRKVDRLRGYIAEAEQRAAAVMDGICYRRQTLSLVPGDGLVLYTDGVTEATDRDQALYGEDRFIGTLRGLLGAHDAGAIIDGIVRDVDDFANGAEQADDITLLAFKLVGKVAS